MSTADIIVAAIVLIAGLIALRLGLVRVVLGLAGWVGATLATIYGFSYARPIAREWISEDLIADIAAGAAIFVVSMIVITFISHRISDSVRDSAFGVLDRSLGLVAGFAIGAIIVCAGYIFSQQVFGLDDKAPFFREARSLPLVRTGAEQLVALAPKEWGLGDGRSGAAKPDGTFRTLLTPKTKTGAGDGKPGYDSKERQEMDRLIRSHQ